VKLNEAQILMGIHLKELGVSFIQEHLVAPGRKWRWDFYLPFYNIAIEIDGYFKGHHGAGYGSDNEKQNVGVMLGYRPLRFSTNDVKRGKAKTFLKEYLNGTERGTGVSRSIGHGSWW
jgi:very-short-patch-repair endonuclease